MGTILIEAAFILPLFLLLCAAIFEFGKVLMVKQVITNAAREATRMAVVRLDDAEALSTAETVSQDYLTRSGVDTSLVTVEPVLLDVDGTEAVQVTISYDYSSTLSPWIPGIPETFGLRSRVLMRREA